MKQTYPLFDKFPALGSVATVRLCDLPTPVARLSAASNALGIDLWVKRDDQTAVEYGGNKPRKLEFLLGRAMAIGVKRVLTFGFAGSNHATATAVYARRVGLSSISMLLAQPSAQYVRDNLRVSRAAGAELHHYAGTPTLAAGLAVVLARHRLREGRFPMRIPAGGSSPLGVLGFVNAGFELARQVEEGLLPEPSVIYVALGSMGSAAGLALGLRAAGLRTQLVAVNVIGDRWAGHDKLARLHQRTARFLGTIDRSFPEPELRAADVQVRDGFLGEGYGRFTEAGREAARLAGELESLDLDGTYTAKTFAALIEDARSGGIGDAPVLFWNTHNASPLPAAAAAIDYHELPSGFHHYFEGPLEDA